jgi:hypothetical protein
MHGAFGQCHTGPSCIAADHLITALADAGYVITPDADGTEHPGAHALREAADDWDALVRREKPPVRGAVWLRARADLLEAGG